MIVPKHNADNEIKIDYLTDYIPIPGVVWKKINNFAESV